MSLLLALLIIILIVAVVYWVSGAVGLPAPFPAIIALVALILLLAERGAIHL